jgi:hypothetical protein
MEGVRSRRVASSWPWGAVVDGPAALLETFGEVKGQPVDIMPLVRGLFFQTACALTGILTGRTYVNFGKRLRIM